MSGDRLSIGKVAARTGCNIETIRFYEKEGLLPPPGRTEGGHRLYTTEMVGRLVFVRRCRELGFSMAEIGQLLSLVDGDQVSCERVKDIADLHLVDIRSKIADLRKMERTLRDLSSQCSGDDVPQCPIIEVLQQTRRQL
ncbi:MAG: helix-turn-helix domain-containing protein [Gammaproteobacteria bacterium]|nr:helix-turn-helix domain-containing protein [Gammaproteobacteria bacterium]